MDTLDCFVKLRDIGCSAREAAGILRVTEWQLRQLENGQRLLPLQDRHGISNYMAFTKAARLWNTANGKAVH